MDQDQQRASDKDREQLAERLKHALDAGRLDLGEYDERLQQAYTAKTYAELNTLIADIPDAAPVSASQLATTGNGSVLDDPEKRRAKQRRNRARDIRNMWSGFGGAAIVMVGIWTLQWVMSDDGVPSFWPAWILGIWGICVLAGTWSKLMKD